MASISDIPVGRSVADAFTSLVHGIGETFVAAGRARARCDEIEALLKLSDAELANRSLTRDQVGRFVHRDKIGF